MIAPEINTHSVFPPRDLHSPKSSKPRLPLTRIKIYSFELEVHSNYVPATRVVRKDMFHMKYFFFLLLFLALLTIFQSFIVSAV